MQVWGTSVGVWGAPSILISEHDLLRAGGPTPPPRPTNGGGAWMLCRQSRIPRSWRGREDLPSWVWTSGPRIPRRNLLFSVTQFVAMCDGGPGTPMWSHRQKGVHLGLEMRSQLSKAGPTAGVLPAAVVLWARQGAMRRPEGPVPIGVTQGPGRGALYSLHGSVPPLPGEERGLALPCPMWARLPGHCVPLCASKLGGGGYCPPPWAVMVAK